MGFALKKRQKLAHAKRYLLLNAKTGSQASDLADALGMTHRNALRYLAELGTIRVGRKYRLIPTPEDVELAHAVLKIPHEMPQCSQRLEIPPVLTTATQGQTTDPAQTKVQRLEQIRRRLLLSRGKSLHAPKLAAELGLPYHELWRYLKELGAMGLGRGRYRLTPTQEDIELAQAVLEAVQNITDAASEGVLEPQARPTERARLTQQVLERAKLFLLLHHGLTVDELASQLGSGRSTTYRYLSELGAIQDENKKYHLTPTPEDIELAHAVLKIPQNHVPHAAQAPAANGHLTKRQRLEQVKRLLLLNQEQGWTAREIADTLGILPRAAWRYLRALGAVSDREAKYRLVPRPEDVELADAVMWAIAPHDIDVPGRKQNE